MASTQRPTTDAARGGLIPADWSAQAADKVVDTIGKVRDKTTRPAQIAARALVYGIVAAVLAVAAVILAVVLVLRAYDNWVPGPLWIAYAALGGLFMIGGLVCFRRANRPATPAA